MPAAIPALAALAVLGSFTSNHGNDPWDLLTGWRAWSDAEDFVTLRSSHQLIHLRIAHLGQRCFRASTGNLDCTLTIVQSRDGVVHFDSDGLRSKAEIVTRARSISVFHDSYCDEFELVDDLAVAEAEVAGGDSISAPMPGLVSAVRTKVGAMVRTGDPLLVLEAMKMEHVLTSPRDGIVAEVFVSEGDQVTDGFLLLRLEAQNG